MSHAECPNCEKMTSLGSAAKIGEHVKCTQCGAESVIVWLNPVELDVLYDDNYSDDDEQDYAYEDDGYANEDYEDNP